MQRFNTKVCTKAWMGVGYKDRLSMLNLTTMETRQTILKHCFLYKVLNGLAFFPNSSIIPRPNTSHDTRSHTLTLQVPFVCTVIFSNSFCCQAPRLWNELPSEVLSFPSIASFKRACYNYVSYPSPHYVFVCVLLPLYIGVCFVLAHQLSMRPCTMYIKPYRQIDYDSYKLNGLCSGKALDLCQISPQKLKQ